MAASSSRCPCCLVWQWKSGFQHHSIGFAKILGASLGRPLRFIGIPFSSCNLSDFPGDEWGRLYCWTTMQEMASRRTNIAAPQRSRFVPFCARQRNNSALPRGPNQSPPWTPQKIRQKCFALAESRCVRPFCFPELARSKIIGGFRMGIVSFGLGNPTVAVTHC